MEINHHGFLVLKPDYSINFKKNEKDSEIIYTIGNNYSF